LSKTTAEQNKKSIILKILPGNTSLSLVFWGTGP